MKYKDIKGKANGMKVMFVAIILSFLAIIAITLTGLTKGDKGILPVQEEEPKQEIHKQEGKELLGIVVATETENNIIKIQNIETGIQQIFQCSKETSFLNRYDQRIAFGQLQCGEIVKLTYDPKTNISMVVDITEEAWEYKKASSWSFDKANKKMQVGQQGFQYTDQLVAYSNGKIIDINSLSSKDELTVKGIGEKVYSIIVTKGHGYLKLKDYEAFLDGNIEVGYEILTKVDEHMEFVLREGEYTVKLKKGTLETTKYVRITRDEETILDLGEYQVEVVRTGKVKFSISPEGATLYINKKQTSFDTEVELACGDYDLLVQLEGHESYQGVLTVGQAFQTVTISLQEEGQETSSPEQNVTVEDTEEKDTPTISPTITPTISPTISPTTSPSTDNHSTQEGMDEDTVEEKIDPNHRITISSPAGAEVYINNTYKGIIPISFEKVIGTDLKLTLKMVGQESKNYTLDVVDDNKDVTWTFNKWWE